MSYEIKLFLSPRPYFLFPSPSAKKPVRLDLEVQAPKDAGSKNDLLYKALGKERGEGKTVLDVTGGLLGDSAHMDKLGYQVTALEKNPQLFAGMTEALKSSDLKIHLLNVDAFEYLQCMNEAFDIIYMDPMFPESAGSALSGKSAQLLKLLAGAGNEDDNKALLELALEKTKGRVILKRPRKSELLREKPLYQVLGQSTRFDVYSS